MENKTMAKNTKTVVNVAKVSASPFAASLAAIRVDGERNANAIFKVASMVAGVLPKIVGDGDGNTRDAVGALRASLADPTARSMVRRSLVALIPGKPAGKKSAANVVTAAAYRADLQNMDRALHVASIVASGHDAISTWDGTTFSMETATLLSAWNKQHPKAKLALFRGPSRLVFGKALAESVIVEKNGSPEAFKASYRNLVLAFPKTMNAASKTKASKATANNYADASKALRAFIDVANGVFSEEQRADMAKLAKELEKAAGIATTGNKRTKLVKAKDADNLPKPAADTANTNATKAA